MYQQPPLKTNGENYEWNCRPTMFTNFSDPFEELSSFLEKKYMYVCTF